MNAQVIFNLIQPCQNRGINIRIVPGYESVVLDGIEFYTVHEAEDYIESKERKDFDE